MAEETQLKIMEAMKGRGIRYYKMLRSETSYFIYHEEIPDQFSNTYAYEQLDLFSNQKLPDFKIRNLELKRLPHISKVEVTLFERIGESALEGLSRNIQQKHLPDSKRVIFGFHLPHMDFNSLYWANSSVENGEVEVSINGFTNEHLQNISNGHSKDVRKVLGKWMSEPSFFTLFGDGENSYILETTTLGQFYEEPFALRESDNYKEFIPLEESRRRKYFRITPGETLEWFDDNGKFMELKPYMGM